MSYKFLGNLEELGTTFSTFPLYDRLCEKIKNEEPCTIEQLEKICSEIKDMPKDKVELVFVLIRTHSLREGQKDVFSLPYDAKKASNEDEQDIEYDIRKLPIKLQSILYQFVKANMVCNSPKLKPTVTPATKSFVKKPIKISEFSLVLNKINTAELDKQYNLRDVVEAGVKIESNHPFLNFTKIESIGVIKEQKKENSSVILGKSSGDILCSYCTLQIQPNIQPVSLNSKHNFCCYNCMLAFSEKNPKQISRKQVLEDHKKLFGNKNFKPSPSYLLLTKFGGCLSPKSYRREIQSSDYVEIPIFNL